MLQDGKPFDTNIFFSGGAGMFLQYHDVVKPVYLYTIFNMILNKQTFGLPLEMLYNMSIFSLIEWYIKRRYQNPLRCLDPLNIIDPTQLDDGLLSLLRSDDSMYRLSPGLNIQSMLRFYRKHKMTFPVYVWTKEEEPYVLKDCQSIFPGVPIKYLYGDLKVAISKCGENFTYILSDIEVMEEISKLLIGTYSHILLAKEYRYNYKDNCKTLKYDLLELARTRPLVRFGTTFACDWNVMALSFKKILSQGGMLEDATNQHTTKDPATNGNQKVEV